jgi:hypothetical protein
VSCGWVVVGSLEEPPLNVSPAAWLPGLWFVAFGSLPLDLLNWLIGIGSSWVGCRFLGISSTAAKA